LSNTENYKFQIITKYLNGKIYKNQAASMLQVSERLELNTEIAITSLIKNMMLILSLN